MRATIHLGRIAGIPVGVHWSVLVIAALLAQTLAASVLPAGVPSQPSVIYWAAAAAITVVFFAALLAHEVAHALTARRYGLRVRRITLWLLGGVAEFDGRAPHARAELLIAGAGPATSLLTAAVFGTFATAVAASGGGDLALTALAWLALVNLVLAVFNLLPGAPLDGGRVLAAVVWWTTGDRAVGQRVATRAGIGVGALLIAAGMAEILFLRSIGGLWLGLLGWFLIAAARAEAADAYWERQLAGVQVEDAMTAPAVCGYAQQRIAEFAAVAQRHPHRTFPVLGLDGFLTGLVTVSRLAQVQVEARTSMRLGDVQTPVEQITVVQPDTPLAQAARAMQAGGHRLAVVTVDHHVCGVLTAADIARAIELIAFGAKPRRHPGALPLRMPQDRQPPSDPPGRPLSARGGTPGGDHVP